MAKLKFSNYTPNSICKEFPARVFGLETVLVLVKIFLKYGELRILEELGLHQFVGDSISPVAFRFAI